MSEETEEKVVPHVNTVLLSEWYEVAKRLKDLRAKESALRGVLFKGAFPKPKEGANTYPLQDGYVLKGNHTLNRDIDEGSYAAIQPKFEEAKISDDVVKKKLSLAKANYNKLNEEQKLLFDQCLLIKPGSPTLEVVFSTKEAKRIENEKRAAKLIAESQGVYTDDQGS